MNFYEVSYTTWEECSQTILSHENFYTQDEFNEILLDAYVEVSKEEEKVHNEWYYDWKLSEDAMIELKDNPYGVDDYAYRPSVSSLYSGVIIYLLDKMEFKNLDIVASFSPSDNYDLVPRKGEDFREPDYDDDLLKKLRMRFNTIEPRDRKIDDILNENSGS